MAERTIKERVSSLVDRALSHEGVISLGKRTLSSVGLGGTAAMLTYPLMHAPILQGIEQAAMVSLPISLASDFVSDNSPESRGDAFATEGIARNAYNTQLPALASILYTGTALMVNTMGQVNIPLMAVTGLLEGAFLCYLGIGQKRQGVN